jgi:hypothetical protein
MSLLEAPLENEPKKGPAAWILWGVSLAVGTFGGGIGMTAALVTQRDGIEARARSYTDAAVLNLRVERKEFYVTKEELAQARSTDAERLNTKMDAVLREVSEIRVLTERALSRK